MSQPTVFKLQFTSGPGILMRRAALSVALAAFYLLVWLSAFGLAPPDATTGLASLLLASALILASVIDLECFRLPDAITLPLAVAGICLGPLLGWSLLMHTLAAIAGYLTLFAAARFYRWIRGHEGLGMGDAKLLGASAAWLGPESIASIILIAAVAALAIVTVLMLAGRRIDKTDALPFGPFLALATWMLWTHGPF